MSALPEIFDGVISLPGSGVADVLLPDGEDNENDLTQSLADEAAAND